MITQAWWHTSLSLMLARCFSVRSRPALSTEWDLASKKHSISTVNKHSTISTFLGCVSASALVQKCLCRGQREQSWVHSPVPQLLYVHKEDALSTGESNTDPEPASEGVDSVVTAAQDLPDFTARLPLQGQPACRTEQVPSSLLHQCTCGHGWAT